MADMVNFTQSCKDRDDHRPVPDFFEDLPDHERTPDRYLIAAYQGRDMGLHTRRTLDQSYYSMILDTSTRDKDQLVSRQWAQKMSKGPVPIVMADQLWLWIIDGKA